MSRAIHFTHLNPHPHLVLYDAGMVILTFLKIFVLLNVVLMVTLLLFAQLNRYPLRLASFGTREDFYHNQITIFFWSFFSTLVVHVPFVADLSYPHWSEYLADFFLLFFCHDIYIYLTHRLLHTKKLYRKVHAFHHQVRTQTPLAAWSVHPVESLIDSLAIVLLGLILPVSLSVLLVYSIFIFKMNLLGHFTLNEQAPRWIKAVLYRYSNFHHHNIHHQRPKLNYGALSLWDRLLKTQTSSYRKKEEGVALSKTES